MKVEIFGLLGTGVALGVAPGIVLGGHSGAEHWMGFLGTFGGAGVTVAGAYLLDKHRQRIRAHPYAMIVLDALGSVHTDLHWAKGFIDDFDETLRDDQFVAVRDDLDKQIETLDALIRHEALAVPGVIGPIIMLRKRLRTLRFYMSGGLSNKTNGKNALYKLLDEAKEAFDKSERACLHYT